jgi:hypothetical protein
MILRDDLRAYILANGRPAITLGAAEVVIVGETPGFLATGVAKHVRVSLQFDAEATQIEPFARCSALLLLRSPSMLHGPKGWRKPCVY